MFRQFFIIVKHTSLFRQFFYLHVFFQSDLKNIYMNLWTICKYYFGKIWNSNFAKRINLNLNNLFDFIYFKYRVIIYCIFSSLSRVIWVV